MATTAEALKKRLNVNPKEGIEKYGNVNFADPVNKKYPIDTPEHVRAAASYFGMPKNSDKYNSKGQSAIGGKIAKAETKFGIGQ